MIPGCFGAQFDAIYVSMSIPEACRRVIFQHTTHTGGWLRPEGFDVVT